MTKRARRPQEIPCIDILFLGSPSVGKATFLSRVPHVQHSSVAERQVAPLEAGMVGAAEMSTTKSAFSSATGPTGNTVPPLPRSSAPTTFNIDVPPPPYASTTSLPTYSQLPLHPVLEPVTFSVSLYARPYSITVHPSTTPLFTDPFPATPHFVIICFAVNSRASLHNAQHYWYPQYHLHYPASSAPAMLLGLQRDLRTAGKDAHGKYVCIMPEEGLEAAREMRCDRYAECSAMTGELMWEVLEDITRTAAKTTLDQDYASDMCTVS